MNKKMHPYSNGFFWHDNLACLKVITNWFHEHNNDSRVLKWVSQNTQACSVSMVLHLYLYICKHVCKILNNPFDPLFSIISIYLNLARSRRILLVASMAGGMSFILASFCLSDTSLLYSSAFNRSQHT